MADDQYLKSMEDSRILGPFTTDRKDTKTMADHLKESITGMSNKPRHQEQHVITGKTVLFATLAGVAIGGPLLGMMGFTLLATITVLIISSPLLLIFSPLLISAAFVLGAAMAGFAVAGLMALAGLAVFTWSYRAIKGRGTEGGVGGQIVDTLTESGQRVKETAYEWGGDLQQKLLQVTPPTTEQKEADKNKKEEDKNKNEDKSKVKRG